jgi:hypothetical protein
MCSYTNGRRVRRQVHNSQPRLRENYVALLQPSDRLVLKHDDVCYSVHDPLFVKSMPIPKTSDGNEGVDTGEVDDKEMPKSERCKRDRRSTP